MESHGNARVYAPHPELEGELGRGEVLEFREDEGLEVVQAHGIPRSAGLWKGQRLQPGSEEVPHGWVDQAFPVRWICSGR